MSARDVACSVPTGDIASKSVAEVANTDCYQPIERKLGLTPTLKNSERRSANA
jgi:hypothetical protein